jgi:D-alanyl-D-alanine carboxypeptidase/D-alanyl-D-alanine-endopeptidase (penicillin-binding protein 4)
MGTRVRDQGRGRSARTGARWTWLVWTAVVLAAGFGLGRSRIFARGKTSAPPAPGAQPALPAASAPVQGSAPTDAARASPAEPGARSRLRARVEREIARAKEVARKRANGKLDPSQVEIGLCVREVGLGPQAEWGLGARRALRPASNMKLVTSAATLVLLGSEWRFVTRAEAFGPLRDGDLAGDLVLRAGADPLYDASADGELAALLSPLIEALRAGGLRRVRGDLVLDEGTFEEPRVPPGWPDESQHWTEYCALAGGFSANRGCLTARAHPGAQVGSPARIELLPRGHGLQEDFGVETAARTSALSIRLLARKDRATVRGSVGLGAAPWQESFAHPDPVRLFGQVLRAELERSGILLEGQVVRRRGVPAGTELARLERPWVDYLAAINRDSTNAVADQLFLALGQATTGQGTRAAAASATRRALDQLGLSSEGFRQIDGSGLSRDNRVDASALVGLLCAVMERPGRGRDLFLDSLARSGAPGTLEKRMGSDELRGRVRAKTGFIGGTSALSGVVERAGGQRVAFSILVNYPNLSGLNDAAWKPMQDAICGLLAEEAP